MSKHARIATGSTAASTSIRNFPNRLGQVADVLLDLAELAVVMGKPPTVEGRMAYASRIDPIAPRVYKYLNFDKMDVYGA
jgi:aconitate hydratase 2/2-methylisocitrate dehydratase